MLEGMNMIIRSVKDVKEKTSVTLSHEGNKVKVGKVIMKWLTHKNLNGENVDFSIRHIVYEPGCDVPTHEHEHCHQVYILKGKLEVSSNGETRLLGPDTLYYVQPFEPHSSRNPTDKPTVILSCINCLRDGDNCSP
jgi:quercetin dioxygenase-like cupin family protein